jgi:plastocyanin domain-containing protein
MNKLTQASVLVVALLIGGAVLLTGNSSPAPVAVAINNVSQIDGKQIIDVQVKGGYTPKRTTAKAGVPTILRFNTNGTFDCSSAVRIPSIGISKNLPPSGTIEIDLGTPQVAILQGVCAMGMYSFQIDFRG